MKSATIDENAAGKALAAVFGAWFVICATLLYGLTGPSMMVGRYMMHGVALDLQPFSLTGAVFGLVAWLILAYVSGYAFAKLYNGFLR